MEIDQTTHSPCNPATVIVPVLVCLNTVDKTQTETHHSGKGSPASYIATAGPDLDANNGTRSSYRLAHASQSDANHVLSDSSVPPRGGRPDLICRDCSPLAGGGDGLVMRAPSS